MKIIIKNKWILRKGRKGFFTHSKMGIMKSGYLVCDEQGRDIGVVFKQDDSHEKNHRRYGQSEILFDEKYENEFGTWCVIKINGNYLPFEDLKEIMNRIDCFAIIIDKRIKSRR